MSDKEFVRDVKDDGADLTYIGVTENGLEVTARAPLVRDEENGAFNQRPEPHKGAHAHMCPRCFIEWEHQPEVCWIKSMATCRNCLLELEEMKRG